MTRRIWVAGLLALLPVAGGLQGQQSNEPRAGYVYPAGGQRGTTFRVTVGGQFLDGVERVLISGDSVKASVVDFNRPLTQPQLAELREKLRALQERRNDPAARDEAAALRAQISENQRRAANPAIAQRVTLEVAVAADAGPGARSLRLGTPRGVTNPLVFHVGGVPEFSEADAEDTRAAMPIAIPSTVNGRIVPLDATLAGGAPRPGQPSLAGDADRFRFDARKGQTIVIEARARGLIPYLADAVPGWFQASLTLFDAAGRELAYADDTRFAPDPVLRYHIPSDGEYVVEIKDALYRGREDFVYRMLIIADGTSSGGKTPCSDDGTTAHLSLPAVLEGCITRARQRDVFTFDGREGERIVAEVIARRLGSPLDSGLELLDPAGRTLAFNDDHEQPMEGLLTHDADSAIGATLPRAGKYTLRITDMQGNGGADYSYRLRISAPRPDFELRVTPSTVNVAPGGSAQMTVVAQRIDGFAGEIALRLAEMPRGFNLTGGVVPAGQNSVRVTLTIPPGTPRALFTIRMEGRASIGGVEVSRTAVAADDMMQAFAYHHLVPADALRVAVSPRRGRRGG